MYVSSINKIKLFTVAVATFANTSAFAEPTPTEKLRGGSPAEIAVACESAMKAADALVASGEVKRVNSDSNVFDCQRTVRLAYEEICSRVDCSSNIFAGFIYWPFGLEFNLPTPVRESELRLIAGVSIVFVEELGTHNKGIRISLVGQGVGNINIKRRENAIMSVPVPAAGGQVTAAITSKPNTLQKIKSGGTLILALRNSYDKMRPQDLFISFNRQNLQTWSGALSSLSKAQVGYSAEIKHFRQSDINNTESWVATGTTNIHGLISRADYFNKLNMNVGNATFLSLYKMVGSIRSESASVGLSGILELVDVNPGRRSSSGGIYPDMMKSN